MPRKYGSRRVVSSFSVFVLCITPLMVATSSSADTELVHKDTTSAPSADKADAFATPTPKIFDCGEGAPAASECGTVQLPLDYDEPDGPTTEVAYVRVPATDQANKIGALFINPGGPGGSGTAFAGNAPELFNEEMRSKFDIVGIDPRGTNKSENVQCFKDTKQKEEQLGPLGFAPGAPPTPVSPEEIKSVLNASEAFGKACSTRGLPLAAHMSTANVARDMDVIRRVVGDDQMNFLGLSYGSYIANVYANLFPDRVRTIVMDGALDPVARAGTPENKDVPPTLRTDAPVSASQSMDEILRLCEEKGPELCSFAAKGEPQENYEKLMNHFKKQPRELDEEGFIVSFDYSTFVGFAFDALYRQNAPERITNFLSILYEEAFEETGQDDDGTGADQQAGPPVDQPLPGDIPNNEAGYENFLDATQVIDCTDSLTSSNISEWPTFAKEAEKRYEGFATVPTWDFAACASKSWTVEDNDSYHGPFTAETANPVLVASNFHDPATTYAEAQAVVDQLPNSRLLSSDSFGHTSYGLSTCMTEAMDNYFINKELPAKDKVCQPDTEPFAGPPAAGGPSETLVEVPEQE